MRKRYKLRSWVIYLIALIAVIMIGLLIISALEAYEAKARKCDEARGYICTHYDVNQFFINGE